MTTTSSRSWREIVEEVDKKDRHRESLYPVVYKFGGGAVQKRDSGPSSGIYAGTGT